MTAPVVPVLGDLRWDPNAPDAQFLSDDAGLAVLMLRPHFNDTDQRTVVIFWTGVMEAQFGEPNDEGMHDHSLYESGLSELLWAGEVVDDAPGGRVNLI